MATIRIQQTYSANGDLVSGTAVLTDDNLLSIDSDPPGITASATVVYPCVFAHANLTAVFLTVDQDATCTFSGSSNPALSMLAGQVYCWHNLSHVTNPFPADCTTLTVINGSSTNTCTVDCRVLYH